MSLEINYLKLPISSSVFELTVKIWGVNWLKQKSRFDPNKSNFFLLISHDQS